MGSDGIGVLIFPLKAGILYPCRQGGYNVVKADGATFVKIGDSVFIAGGKYRHGHIEYWVNTGKLRLSDVGKLGKTVFLTREKAEEKIAEWKMKKYDPTYDPQWERTDEEI